MVQDGSAETHRALGLLPSVACVMTSAFEGRRAGTLVQWVVQCADDPVFVCVVPRKGHPIAPLIRDSHAFGLCLVDRAERLLLRRFNGDPHHDNGDPFDSLNVLTLHSGVPLLGQAAAVLDCEVVRHFDLEADHEIYVGHVHAARDFTDRSPT